MRWGLILVAIVGLVPEAGACGGLFCSSVPVGRAAPPAPVDQTSERIIFDVAEGQTTATVTIQYSGTAEEFAWVVPVLGVPTIAEGTMARFTALEALTALSVRLPRPITAGCPVPSFADGSPGCGGFGCGASADSFSAGSGATASNAGGSGSEAPPVTVYAHDVTANYEYHVLGAEKTSELVSWLQTNGYNVSDNMTPVMDAYNSPDMRFLAVKLREGRKASDIVPLSMTYAGDRPMIPLRLTAVAARPLMGIQVFIVASTPYVPEPPYGWVPADTRELVFDAQGNTNYFEWVARMAAESEGRRFVLENVVKGTAATGSAGSTVTRLYTRLSPEQMTVDPAFGRTKPLPAPPTGLLDLSTHPSLYRCGQVIPEALPSPCAFNYCGLGATCAVVAGQAACRCPAGAVAQDVTGPDGSPHVTCVPRVNPLGITPAAGGEGTAFDPCKNVDCGTGACVLRSGFPACDCLAGVGVLQGGVLSCQAPATLGPTFGPGAGRESAAPATAWIAPAPRTRPARFGGPVVLLLLLSTLVMRRAIARVRARAATPART